MAAEVVDGDQEVMVGRNYTRARRYAPVIGRIPGSRSPLIGGPYSLPQLGAMVGVFVVLVLTREAWARFGLVGNLLVVAAVPVGAGWVVRRLQVQGRPPWSVAAAVLGLFLSPAAGRMGGRPLPRPRARRVGGVFTFHLQPAEAVRPAHVVEPTARVRRPGAGAAGEQPVLSPAQALLAARRGGVHRDGRA